MMCAQYGFHKWSECAMSQNRVCYSKLNPMSGDVLQRAADVPFSLPGPAWKTRRDLHRLGGREVGPGWSHTLGNGQGFVQLRHRGRGRVDATRYALQ